MTALILAAHGSGQDPHASQPVHTHGARLRERGTFSGVHTAFWKEEPVLSRVLDLVPDWDVVVVPVFMASGYYAEQVVPREMGITGPVTRIGDKVVRYSRPVGTHPAIAEVMRQRAIEAGADASWSLAVLGHGTTRNAHSRDTTFEQAARMDELGMFAEVEPIFLDDEPNVRQVFSLLPGNVVIVPFFVADGWHVGTSVPEVLAEQVAEHGRDGRKLQLAGAVGSHPLVSDVIEALAREALDYTT